MMPVGHLAFGYVLYSLGERAHHARPPGGPGTLALVLGTQVPDLVDKPLNWWFGVFDGRAIGHSVLVLGPLCIGVYLLARRRDWTAPGAALGVGAFSHLLGDAWQAIVAGAIVERAPYLLWPLLPAPTYAKEGVLDHLDGWLASGDAVSWTAPTALLSDWVAIQAAIAAVATLLWAYDGFPGLRTGLDVLRDSSTDQPRGR